MFPHCGKIKDAFVLIENKSYPLKSNGFARDLEFSVINQSENSVVFELIQNEYTLERFPYNFSLQVKYELTNNKDISKVVLYFLGIENNLIPITKYVNDDREKIEIIIESLSSNYIFYDNLVSVASFNLELLNYKFEDDTLILNFNSFINDVHEKKVVNEDLINMISYSVFDNYDISKVIFMEKDNKIVEKLRKDIENF